MVNCNRWEKPILVVLLALALLARLTPIAANRFHRDEALYSGWALQVATGRDVMLNDFPVDKPPLFLYTLALTFNVFGPSETTARLPSVVASWLSVGLVWWLGRRLYGPGVGLAAAALMAFSPFNLLFAPTVFTDPLLVMWVLASLAAVVEGRWGWAGALLGLAEATKQQGVFFLPLVLAVGWITAGGHHPSPHLSSSPIGERERGGAGGGEGEALIRFILAFVAAFAPAIVWDLARTQRPGFLQQSALSYGGLSAVDPAQLVGRFREWADLLQYFTASRPLNVVLVAGVPLLLVWGWLSRRRARADTSFLVDSSLVAFIFLFLAAHWLLNFQVWDRYLLGLVPVAALLLARVVWAGGELASGAVAAVSQRIRRGRSVQPRSSGVSWRSLLIALFLAVTLYRPAQDAMAGRFPIGGDHGAYDGIDAVVSYFRGNVPARAIVYHRWLGWHFSFYLFDFPYNFRWYTSPQELVAGARAASDVPRYIVFPSWRSATETEMALKAAGMELQRAYWTYRRDGTVSFTIYQIVGPGGGE